MIMKNNDINFGKMIAKRLFILNILLVWISSIMAGQRIEKDNPVEMSTLPTSAEVVGTVGGNIFYTATRGNYAFIAQGYRLVVLDLQAPAGDNVVTTLNLNASVRTGLLSGDRLYLSPATWDVRDTFIIIDIADPMNPRILSQTNIPGVDSYISKISVSNGFACLGAGQSLNYLDKFIVLDITDPGSPVVVANQDIAMIDWVSIGIHAYLIQGDVTTGVNNKLTIIDVSGSAGFQEVGSLDLIWAYRIEGKGSSVYVAHANSTQGLKIIDVTNPQQPQVTGQFTSGNAYTDVVLDDQVVFLMALNKVIIVDISDANNPQYTSEYDFGMSYFMDHATGDALAVRKSQQFVLLDVTDPANPVLREPYNSPSVIRDIAIGGERLYCVTDNKLWAYDLSDPANPHLTEQVDVVNGNKVFFNDNTVYVADKNQSVTVFDVSGGGTPVQLAPYQAGAMVLRMGFREDHAYVLTTVSNDPNQDQAMLEILNVGDPSNPTQVGNLQLAGDGIDLFVPETGNLVYAAFRKIEVNQGFQVIDVTLPASPAVVHQTEVQHIPQTVTVVGNSLFLGINHTTDFYGIAQVYDVTDPVNPVYKHDYDVSTESRLSDFIYLDDFLVMSVLSGEIITYDYNFFGQVFTRGPMVNVPWPQTMEGYIPSVMEKAFSSQSEQQSQYIYAISGWGHEPFIEGNYGVTITETIKAPATPKLILNIATGNDQFYCPYELGEDVLIAQGALEAKGAAWEVSSMTFTGEGNGRSDG